MACESFASDKFDPRSLLQGQVGLSCLKGLIISVWALAREGDYKMHPVGACVR